jgi:hypothetical protein
MQMWMNRDIARGLMSVLVLAIGTSVAAPAQDGGRDRDSGQPGTRTKPPAERPETRVKPPDERPDRYRWTLGIAGDATDTGVVVREVRAGSAAERVGLERNDLIVTVDGYQVGRVGGREYPLDAELERRADGRGRVRLLVQNRRNNRLQNMDVQLDRTGGGGGSGSREQTVSGSVGLPDDNYLPHGSELRMRIVRRKLLGTETVGERTISVCCRPPLRYQLNYDPRRVENNDTLELKAELWINGRRQYSESRTYRFRPSEMATRLDIELRRS